jgi:DnaJ-class molecular chaperone
MNQVYPVKNKQYKKVIESCTHCGGGGTIFFMKPSKTAGMIIPPCMECHTCNGRGYVERMEELSESVILCKKA